MSANQSTTLKRLKSDEQEKVKNISRSPENRKEKDILPDITENSNKMYEIRKFPKELAEIPENVPKEKSSDLKKHPSFRIKTKSGGSKSPPPNNRNNNDMSPDQESSKRTSINSGGSLESEKEQVVVEKMNLKKKKTLDLIGEEERGGKGKVKKIKVKKANPSAEEPNSSPRQNSDFEIMKKEKIILPAIKDAKHMKSPNKSETSGLSLEEGSKFKKLVSFTQEKNDMSISIMNTTASTFREGSTLTNDTKNILKNNRLQSDSPTITVSHNNKELTQMDSSKNLDKYIEKPVKKNKIMKGLLNEVVQDQKTREHDIEEEIKKQEEVKKQEPNKNFLKNYIQMQMNPEHIIENIDNAEILTSTLNIMSKLENSPSQQQSKSRILDRDINDVLKEKLDDGDTDSKKKGKKKKKKGKNTQSEVSKLNENSTSIDLTNDKTTEMAPKTPKLKNLLFSPLSNHRATSALGKILQNTPMFSKSQTGDGLRQSRFVETVMAATGEKMKNLIVKKPPEDVNISELIKSLNKKKKKSKSKGSKSVSKKVKLEKKKLEREEKKRKEAEKLRKQQEEIMLLEERARLGEEAELVKEAREKIEGESIRMKNKMLEDQEWNHYVRCRDSVDLNSEIELNTLITQLADEDFRSKNPDDCMLRIQSTSKMIKNLQLKLLNCKVAFQPANMEMYIATLDSLFCLINQKVHDVAFVIARNANILLDERSLKLNSEFQEVKVMNRTLKTIDKSKFLEVNKCFPIMEDFRLGIFINAQSKPGYRMTPVEMTEIEISSEIPRTLMNSKLIMKFFWCSFDYLSTFYTKDISQGGIMNIECFQFLPLPKKGPGWTIKYQYENDFPWKAYNYPNVEPGLAPSMQMINPFRVTFKVPDYLYINLKEPIRVGLWDKNIGWSNEYIDDVRFDAEKRIISFTSLRLRPFSIVKERCYEYPYKFWSLRTINFKKAHLLIKGKRNEFEFEIESNKISLKSPVFNEILHLVKKPMAPEDLFYGLGRSGFNLMPNEQDAYIANICSKSSTAEKLAIEGIMMKIYAFNFKSSRWNLFLNEEKIIITMRGNMGYFLEEEELPSDWFSVIFWGNKCGLTVARDNISQLKEDLVSETKTHSNLNILLNNYVGKYPHRYAEYAEDYKKNEKIEFLETVRATLLLTKCLSFT